MPGDTRLSLPRGLWRYHVDRKRILVGGALGNGGNLHEWIRETLRIDADPVALDGELLERAAACHGLTMLPFLAGERSVGWNPRARAAVIGMSLETTAVDILQAGMEAVAYRFAAVQRLLDVAGGPAGQTVAHRRGALSLPGLDADHFRRAGAAADPVPRVRSFQPRRGAPGPRGPGPHPDCRRGATAFRGGLSAPRGAPRRTPRRSKQAGKPLSAPCRGPGRSAGHVDTLVSGDICFSGRVEQSWRPGRMRYGTS